MGWGGSGIADADHVAAVLDEVGVLKPTTAASCSTTLLDALATDLGVSTSTDSPA